MDHRCIACGKSYGHRIGLTNHRRACVRWKEYDGLAKYKKRRLEVQLEDLQTPIETTGPMQEEDSTVEVHTYLLFYDFY
jgi:hypothetical protein